MKEYGFRKLAGALISALATLGSSAFAADAKYSDNVIRIGVLNDRNGLYADMSGEGSAIAARMAAAEFGNKIHGIPVEIVTGDHQNKTDVGTAVARKWFDADRVDVIVDVVNSAVSLAINSLVVDRKKLVLHNSVSSDITGKACTNRSAQWQYTTRATAYNLVDKKMVQDGTDKFFIIAVDYAMGQSITDMFRQSVEAAGGKIVGVVRHPLNTTDFSSYLLQARASGANAIMLANAGSDMATVIRQAREFGITPDIKLFGDALTKDVVKSTGLDDMQGLQFVSRYEMYRDDAALDWGNAFMEKNKNRAPTELQAATYSSVRTYLKAIDEIDTDDADAVMAQMRKMKINDAFAANGHLRPDGIMAHDLYHVSVKSPDQSKGDGDYSNVIRVIPGDQANIPLEQSECPLVHK
ncbi:ABC transporter substrate-binding protein [Advenella mimigardefordensis]|uniref:Putative branched-chain amino acid-binding protein n=1 Tax=Advenella mimigardefordensis (strain DSM 17166 / LMG 22922 / DPN7) TaxID=1247726 RepID=W0PGB1_ADVMD|nr:ABC transporter substrate-binding protein [Advenella mimigardefordensis]AHG64153.1 putative branched-chain amino acid-binding protein [Advenella mimigardefordensis DPN7]